jgi:hypothetical protein
VVISLAVLLPFGTLTDKIRAAMLHLAARAGLAHATWRQRMRRGLLLAVVALVGVGLLTSAAEWSGLAPFGPHQSLSYAQFLGDIGAGRVDEIVQWRNRLLVTEAGEQFLIVAPEGTDIRAAVAAARPVGVAPPGVGGIPDNWLITLTPFVPVALLVVGLLAWLPSVMRRRGGRRGDLAHIAAIAPR